MWLLWEFPMYSEQQNGRVSLTLMKICPSCNNPPGAIGCTKVLQQCSLQVKGKTYVVDVDHTNKVDQVCRAHETDEQTALLME